MAQLSYVCLYLSYLEALGPYSDEERGRIMTAMLRYAATGEIPDFSGSERYVWPLIKSQIDRDMAAYDQKCQRNRQNGAKGGRPPINPTVIPETERFSEKPRKPKEKGIEKVKGNEMERVNADIPQAPAHIAPPTIEEVRKFCTENHLTINADKFFNHYSAVGWVSGQTPVVDWQSLARKWDCDETKTVEPPRKNTPIPGVVNL